MVGSSSPIAASPRGQVSRERILAAARGLFAERGFAPVTMRAIGQAAGLDNSSLYRHFASKSDLARAVLHEAMSALGADLAPAVARVEATRASIIDLVIDAAGHLWERPETARLVLHWVISAKDAATGFDVSLPLDAAGTPSGALFRRVVSILAAAREAGEVRDVAWPDAFVMVVAAITLRPATYGSFAASQEPRRSVAAARRAWEAELRVLMRGALTP